MLENIESEDYVGFFSQAVSLIDSTCDEYEPEG